MKVTGLRIIKRGSRRPLSEPELTCRKFYPRGIERSDYPLTDCNHGKHSEECCFAPWPKALIEGLDSANVLERN